MMSNAVAATRSTKSMVSGTTTSKASHPTYEAMIEAAVRQLKERKGASKQAIFKYITSTYKLGDNNTKINTTLCGALKRGVSRGILTQATGSGAAGRFRLPKSAAPTAPKKVVVKMPTTISAEKKSKSSKKATKPNSKTSKSLKKPVATPKKTASKAKKAVKA